MVFQIVDDLLDIIATDEELGKPAGHDMEEGVYTLPVLLTLAAGGAASNELTDILGKPLSSYERDKALSIVRSGPGVASAIDSAQSYVQLCDQYCNKLPQSAATDALRAAPSVLLNSVIR
jgi:heptaprenyl diphosphate synthase